MRKKVQALLTAAQKVKLATLDEARKLRTVIYNPECQNLLDPILPASQPRE